MLSVSGPGRGRWVPSGRREEAWSRQDGIGLQNVVTFQNSSDPWHFIVGLVARFKQLRQGFLRRPRFSTKGLPLPGLQHKEPRVPQPRRGHSPLTTLSSLPQITVVVEAEAAGTATAQADRPTTQGHMGATEALGVAPHTKANKVGLRKQVVQRGMGRPHEEWRGLACAGSSTHGAVVAAATWLPCGVKTRHGGHRLSHGASENLGLGTPQALASRARQF